MIHDVKCRLFFSGPDVDIQSLIHRISTKKPKRDIDFEKIIPYPENIYKGPLTAEALREHGTNNWYEFNRRYWGAYYNAYETERTGNMIEFLTAWKPPLDIIRKLSTLFPNILFNLKWCGQSPDGYAGEMVVENGEPFYDYTAAKENKAEFYQSMWGFPMPEIEE